MSEPVLSRTRIRAGIWEGVLSGAEGVTVEAQFQGAVLPGLVQIAIPDRPGEQAVHLPIPAEILSEGVQTILLRDSGSGRTLAHFTIVTGVPLEQDIRAEIDLLRAELDMLKRAFRRHCLETAG